MLYVLGYLALSTAVMAFALYWSAKKTLYSYANIVLIGGLLFNSVFLIVCTRFLLTIPLDTAVDFTYFYESLLAFPRTFSYYAFFVILFICVLLGISNVELIRHEGFRLHNALSLLVAGLYGGGTMAVYLIADKLYESIFVPLGLSTNPVFIVLSTVIPLFLLLVLCYFECILAGTGILGWIAARAVPAYDKDYIIILGCSIDKRGGLLPLLRGRVNRAVRFAWEQEIATGKALRYVPSGGQGPNEIMSEGSAMGFYLMTHGAEEYEVIPEKQSRNTWENFCFSKKLIEEMTPHPKVAFATTNYHILRSGILANKAGLDAQGIAGDTKWYFWPNGFVREFFGILAMERKVHLRAVAVIAAVCAVVGCVEFLGFIA
uniref:YdcF family protein n=1 Tax=Gemmiger formicilis TaxID=745368 RepID=UPI003FEE8B7E